MTEAEWLASDDIGAMIRCPISCVSDRKLRLFAGAICRRLWEHIPPPGREAVWVVEDYADGKATDTQRWEALRDLVEAGGGQAVFEASGRSWAFVRLDFVTRAIALILIADGELLACAESGRAIGDSALGERGLPARVAECCLEAAYVTPSHDAWQRSLKRGPLGRAWNAIKDFAVGRSSWSFDARAERIHQDEWASQANLLRDIFGNPFRPVVFDSMWRTDTVLSLARGMYESRDFSAMPILADALQDAGCEHADILNHCRDEKQTHVRGCWVVDLVLGKE